MAAKTKSANPPGILKIRGHKVEEFDVMVLRIEGDKAILSINDTQHNVLMREASLSKLNALVGAKLKERDNIFINCFKKAGGPLELVFEHVPPDGQKAEIARGQRENEALIRAARSDIINSIGGIPLRKAPSS